MLIVVGVIVLLVSLVLVSLKGLRGAAAQTSTMSDLRQVVMAYRGYLDQNDQRLMPGYMSQDVFDQYGTTTPQEPGSKMYARLPDGVVLDQFAADGRGDSSSYLWRLAPYLDHAWRTLFADLNDSALVDRLQREFDGADGSVIGGDEVYGPGTAGMNDIGISERPAYGLNSIFLGGDAMHGDADTLALNPWNPAGNQSHAATRLTQVKNPSRVIVFAPTAKASTAGFLPGPPGPPGAPVYDSTSPGFAELRPPFTLLDGPTNAWINCQWIVGERGLVELTPNGDYAGPGGAGLPIARALTDHLPVAHLDGSATIEQLSELARDMTRWSPFEVGRRATNPSQ